MKQDAQPLPRRFGDVGQRHQRFVRAVDRCVGHVQRQQEERAGIGARVPCAHFFRRAAVPHENRVEVGAQITLEKQRGLGAGRYEVAERAEYHALAECLTFVEQLRGGRGEPDPFALQCLERVQLGFQRSYAILGAQELLS